MAGDEEAERAVEEKGEEKEDLVGRMDWGAD